jgi:ATP-binding cassette subfamily B (MDR/TAP) protein 1
MSFKNKVVEEEDLEAPKTDDETPKEVSIWRILGEEPSEIPKMVFGSIFGFIAGCAQPAFSVLFGKLITAILITKDREELKHTINWTCLYFLGIAVGAFIFTYAMNACWAIAGEKIARKIRDRYFRALLKQEIAYFDRHTSGAISSSINSDIVIVQAGISEKFGNLFSHLGLIIVGLVLAFYYGWKMSLILLGCAPILVIWMAANGFFIAKFTQRGQEELSKAAEVSSEALGGIRTIYSFVAESILVQKHLKLLSVAYGTNRKKAHLSALTVGGLFFFMFAIYAITWWYGGKLIRGHEMYVGELLTVFMNIIWGIMGFGFIAQILPDVMKAKGAAAGIFALLDRVPEINTNEGIGLTLPQIDGKITFQNVSFAYPTRSDTKVLRKLNLVINKGQSVALVGPSGSGKSTVIQLLERFYDPLNGTVMIDDIDIKDFDLKWFRRNVGLVSQEPTLFSGTITENILFGNPDATFEEVENAAKMANAYDFITKQPNGFNTLVGEKGTQLSGGQKQRIAIARAVLKNPKILLLDEATSALDTESERLVQSALDNLMKGRTTIIIAHRLSTIRNTNVICVMMNGKIVEQGTHDQLLELNGVYTSLAAKQLSDIEAKIVKKERKMQVSISQMKESVAQLRHSSVSQIKDSQSDLKNSQALI